MQKKKTNSVGILLSNNNAQGKNDSALLAFFEKMGWQINLDF